MSVKEQTSHRQILRSSSIIGGASVINILISLLRIKVVAVLLGPAGIGLMGILQNLMNTASIISSLGVDNVGTRQIAEAASRNDQVDMDAVRRALFWGTMILAAAGGGVFWALRYQMAQWVFADHAMADTIGWLSIGVAVSVAASAQSALLTGMRRIGDIARVQIISATLFTIMGIAAIAWLGEKGLLLYILVVPLTGFFVSHVFVARLPAVQSQQTPFSILSGHWQVMIRLGIAFMVAGLTVILGQLLIRVMVQGELGTDAVGYFHAAFAISVTYMGFIAGAMGTDFYPRLTATIHDHEKSNNLINEQGEVGLLLAGSILVAMISWAPLVIRILYSSEFESSISVLRWQILGDVLKIVSWPLGYLILASGDGRKFLFTEVVAMAVFVGVTWFGLPVIGLNATGVSFFAMYAIYFPLVSWLGFRRTGFTWCISVKLNVAFLFISCAIIFYTSTYNNIISIALGTLISILYGIFAFYRLATIAEIGGPVGNFIVNSNKFLIKIGLINSNK